MVRPKRPYIDDGGYDEYERLGWLTEGFDVNSAGRLLSGGIVPYDVSKSQEERRNVSRIAKFALQKYNQENNSDLRFYRLIKVNFQSVGGGMYYITFEASSLTTCQIKVYQAKVWEDVLSNLDVKIFREKPYTDADVTKNSTSNTAATSTPSMPISISIPIGTFLRFRADVGKIIQSLHMKKPTRFQINSLASKAWRSMSTEEKVKYFHTRSLNYEVLTQLGSMDMQKMSEARAKFIIYTSCAMGRDVNGRKLRTYAAWYRGYFVGFLLFTFVLAYVTSVCSTCFSITKFF